MDIRKLIREELQSFFNESNESNDEIVGTDIVNRLNDLPQTRDEVKWKNQRMYYSLPDLQNINATIHVFEKDFFTGWNKSYMRQGKEINHSGIGYINEFENLFGEKPIFKINGRNIEILNPKFNEWRNK